MTLIQGHLVVWCQLIKSCVCCVYSAHHRHSQTSLGWFLQPADTHVSHVAGCENCSQEERRREQIRAKKSEREASLSAKVEQLAAIRRLASAQASARKAAATVQRAQTAAAVMQRHEAGALALADRLDAKYQAAAAEEARLAAEQKRIRFEQMQNAAGASAVEAARFK